VWVAGYFAAVASAWREAMVTAAPGRAPASGPPGRQTPSPAATVYRSHRAEASAGLVCCWLPNAFGFRLPRQAGQRTRSAADGNQAPFRLMAPCGYYVTADVLPHSPVGWNQTTPEIVASHGGGTPRNPKLPESRRPFRIRRAIALSRRWPVPGRRCRPDCGCAENRRSPSHS